MKTRIKISLVIISVMMIIGVVYSLVWAAIMSGGNYEITRDAADVGGGPNNVGGGGYALTDSFGQSAVIGSESGGNYNLDSGYLTVISGGPQVGSGVMAEWHFNEGTGQTAVDSTVNGNNGTLGSSDSVDAYDPTWIPGRVGTGLEFRKEEDSDANYGNKYVECEDNYSLNPSSGITIALWLEPYYHPYNNSAVLAKKADGQFERYQLGFVWDAVNEKLIFNGTVQCEESDPYGYVASTVDVTTNEWHHFAVTYDSAAASDNLKLYVDGQLASTDNTEVGGAITGSATELFLMGNRSKQSSNYYTYIGAMDELKIYDVALSSTEVAALYSVVPSTAPHISSISPTTEVKGSTVTISGTNFGSSQGSSKVYFYPMVEATVTSWNNTSITCKVPDGTPSYEENKVRVMTEYGSNGVWFTPTEPLKWSFETGTEYWHPRKSVGLGLNLGCTNVVQSDAYSTQGSYSLEMQMDLQYSTTTKKSGEAFVLYPYGDLDGKMIACDVYVSTGAAGSPPSNYNGLQLFVKDCEYFNEYGKWYNITADNQWYRIYLTVDGVSDGTGSVIDENFDPTKIVQIGVKMGLNDYATQDFSGSIYVDNVCVDVPTPSAPGTVPASNYSFSFTNMTAEIQASKSFADYSEHRPFWDAEEGWNAYAWNASSVTIETVSGNKVLSIDADLKGEDAPSDNNRKGWIRIEPLPNFNISNKSSKVIQARIKFADLNAGEYIGCAKWYIQHRGDTTGGDQFVGSYVPVGGNDWQEISVDVSSWSVDKLQRLSKMGIQFWADVAYSGKIYIDNITIGGEENTGNFTNQNTNFVTTDGTHFEVDSEPFFFAGSNSYYPWYKTAYMVDDIMDTLDNNGIKVVRTWGFGDGLAPYAVDSSTPVADGNEGCAFQPTEGKYDELTFRQLDYMIKAAGERGMRLIIPLVNYWSDADKLNDWPSNGGTGVNSFGGIAQYVEWCSLDTDADGVFEDADYYNSGDGSGYPYKLKGEIKNKFFAESMTKACFKEYIKEVLNRINLYTGVKYKDDPTIMAWELANEPEWEDGEGENRAHMADFRVWVSTMTDYIKNDADCLGNQATKQLVALGDSGFMNNGEGTTDPEGEWIYDGFKGVDWWNILNMSTVDFGTIHTYPDWWPAGDTYMTSTDVVHWIDVHIDTAATVNSGNGKPVVFEEFGILKTNPPSGLVRNDEYTAWTNEFYSYKQGAGGDCIWMIAGKVNNTDEDNYPTDPELYYPDYDGFTFWDHAASAETMGIYTQHASAMNNKIISDAMYTFEDGTTNGWIASTGTAITSPSTSTAQAYSGEYSLGYPLDATQAGENKGCVNPSPAKDLSSYGGIDIYVYLSDNINIVYSTSPITVSAYVETGASSTTYQGDGVDITNTNKGSWQKARIDFTGESVSDTDDVRAIGVHIDVGAGSTGTGTLYVDDVRAYEGSGGQGSPLVDIIDTTFKLGEVYTFPNPAKRVDPTLHIEVGIADEVEVTIYNVAAERVKTFSITGIPAIIESKYAYERIIDGLPSGVYIYHVKAIKQGERDITVVRKMAIIK